MSLTELIVQARYGSANGYDNLDMMRESLTKPEKQALLDVIEEEFEDMREDIIDALYNIDCSFDFSSGAELLTIQAYKKLEELYNHVLDIINEEENYLNARLKGRDRDNETI